MRMFKLMVLALAVSVFATAMPIGTLYSTGMNVSGGVDQSWQLVGGTAYVTVDTGGQFPFNAWVANDANSKWISPQANYAPLGTDANGTYTFTTTFDLTGYNPSTAWFDFSLAGDDSITSVTLNSTPLIPGGIPAYAGGAMNGVYTASTGFISGLNTITVQVLNQGGAAGNPTGFRMEIGESNAEALNPIPEPATFALVGLALAALPLVRRKR